MLGLTICRLKAYHGEIVGFLNEILLVLFLNCCPKTGDSKIIKTEVLDKEFKTLDVQLPFYEAKE